MATIARPGVIAPKANATGIAGRIGCVSLVTFTLLIGWAVLSLMPLFWMTSISVTRVVTLLKMPPALLPNPLTFENYQRLFAGGFFLRWLLNSMFITTANTVLSLFISSFYGYIFAKKT